MVHCPGDSRLTQGSALLTCCTPFGTRPVRVNCICSCREGGHLQPDMGGATSSITTTHRMIDARQPNIKLVTQAKTTHAPSVSSTCGALGVSCAPDAVWSQQTDSAQIEGPHTVSGAGDASEMHAQTELKVGPCPQCALEFQVTVKPCQVAAFAAQKRSETSGHRWAEPYKARWSCANGAHLGISHQGSYSALTG